MFISDTAAQIMTPRNSFYRDLFFSVVGGIVTAILIWAWTNLLPLLQGLMNRDEPRVGKKWKTTFKEGNVVYHENVTLKQRGRKIRGEIVLQSDAGEVTTYRLEGNFKHLILTGTYESTNKADYERGAFALRYTNRKKFTGHYILFSKGSDQLISSQYEWAPM